MLTDMSHVWHVVQDLQQHSVCVAGHELGHLLVSCSVTILTYEDLVNCQVIELLSHGYKLNVDMRAWRHCRHTGMR